jgi:hypothetical protein
MVGMESSTRARGGMVGMESSTRARGGMVGMESSTRARGGMVGMESVRAKAELATAQPATKAIRLIFITITPSGLLKGASMRIANQWRRVEVRAT